MLKPSRIEKGRDTMNDNHICADDASTAGRPDTARRGHTRPSVRACVTARLRALGVLLPASGAVNLAGDSPVEGCAYLSPGACRRTYGRREHHGTVFPVP